MTRDDLVAWAARHGLTVIPTVHYNALCAEAAERIAASTDLDGDLAALMR